MEVGMRMTGSASQALDVACFNLIFDNGRRCRRRGGRRRAGYDPGGFMLSSFSRFFVLCWLMLALLAAIFAHLVALGPHLVAKLLQDGANIAQHSPT